MTTIKYNKVIINFIYSFSWDVLNSDFEQLVKKAESVVTKVQSEKWSQQFLHDRHVNWLQTDEQASYQPNIFSQNFYIFQLLKQREQDLSQQKEIFRCKFMDAQDEV